MALNLNLSDITASAKTAPWSSGLKMASDQVLFFFYERFDLRNATPTASATAAAIWTISTISSSDEEALDYINKEIFFFF